MKNKPHWIHDVEVQNYCKTNPIFEKFMDTLDTLVINHYRTNLQNLDLPLIRVEIGRIYIRIWVGNSCWGFISRVDAQLKNSPIKKGDLLKPASWKAPAKHARGNITNGTARYTVYGPEYLTK